MRSKNYARPGPALLLLSLSCPDLCSGASPPASPVREPLCRNTSSGVTWRIRIDLGRRTVNGLAATVAPDRIAWHDPSDNRRYVLDRRSGALTVTTPSSTGGWMLQDRCDVTG